MKLSQRYLRGTFYALAVTAVLSVVFNRLFMPVSVRTERARTSAAELATMRDFDSVTFEGDIDLTVRQQPAFALEYQPLSPVRGQFFVSMQGRTLVIFAYDNRGPDEKNATSLVIGVPQLTRLQVHSSGTVAIEDFAEGQPAIRINGDADLALRHNTAALEVDLFGVRKAQLDALSHGHTKLHIVGSTVIESMPD